MSVVGSSTSSGTPSAFLSFSVGRRLGPEVGHRRGHDDDVGVVVRAHRRLHLGRGLDPHHLDARPDRAGRGGDERDVGPPGGGLLGQGVALLARRAVADEAHRVDRLAGAAGGDEDAHAGEVAGALAEDALDGGHDVGRLGQAARALVAAGQAADAGLDHVDAAAAQHGQVVLHGRVLPHLGVHGRAHDDRRPGGQQGGGEQVVGDAGGVGAEHPGGGRRHHDEVGALAEPGVRDRLGASHSDVRAGSDASAEKVRAPTKRGASWVRTGLTWAPASTSRRHTSTAL